MNVKHILRADSIDFISVCIIKGNHIGWIYGRNLADCLDLSAGFLLDMPAQIYPQEPYDIV